jgi:hypothetical protein
MEYLLYVLGRNKVYIKGTILINQINQILIFIKLCIMCDLSVVKES